MYGTMIMTYVESPTGGKGFELFLNEKSSAMYLFLIVSNNSFFVTAHGPGQIQCLYIIHSGYASSYLSYVMFKPRYIIMQGFSYVEALESAQQRLQRLTGAGRRI